MDFGRGIASLLTLEADVLPRPNDEELVSGLIWLLWLVKVFNETRECLLAGRDEGRDAAILPGFLGIATDFEVSTYKMCIRRFESMTEC